MANVVITLKIMPESPDTDFGPVEEKARAAIAEYAGETETKSEKKPVAFGLESLNIIFVVDESKGGTDTLEKQISEISGVNSVEVIDVRRAIG